MKIIPNFTGRALFARACSAFLLVIMALLPTSLSAKNVLLASGAGSSIDLFLRAQGHIVTNATVAQMATISFSPYDSIILPEGNYGSTVFPGRNLDFVTFANRGGVMHLEEAGANDPIANLPAASGIVAVTGLAHQSVQIIAAGHPVNASLSNTGLSNWGQSIHVYYSSIGNGTEIQRDGDNGQAVTLDIVQGAGHFIYTGLHSISHDQTEGKVFINNIAGLGYNARFAASGSLAMARYDHTSTLLQNGKVLVAGGYGGGYLPSAEIYDPATGTWSAAGSLLTARRYHTATLLPNGKVLVAGGYNGTFLASAELYDPATGIWTTTGSLATARQRHTATLLPNGKVLIAGGIWPRHSRQCGTLRSRYRHLDCYWRACHCPPFSHRNSPD